MTALDKYMLAVAQRKARDRKQGFVNVAVLIQLEDKDVPLLLEIIRVQHEALVSIEAEPLGDEGGLHSTARIALRKVEELAATGSSERWGAYQEGHNA